MRFYLAVAFYSIPATGRPGPDFRFGSISRHWDRGQESLLCLRKRTFISAVCMSA